MNEILKRCIAQIMEKGYSQESASAIGLLSFNMSATKTEDEVMGHANKLCEDLKSGELRFADLETKDADGVEIFATGTWNGDPYSVDDLEKIVEAFQATKEQLKPYLKLGHNKEQKILQKDGLPAAGWIENIRRVGTKLVADFKRVPKKIYDLITAGGYRRVSSEFYINWLDPQGKRHPFALRAVALLGGDTPAVQNLNDVLALYAAGGEVVTHQSESKTYDIQIPKEGDDMNEIEQLKKDLAAANARVLELEGKEKQITELTQKLGDAAKTIGDLQKQNDQLASDVKKFTSERDEAQINSTLDKLIQDKKILPAQRSILFSLLTHAKVVGEKKFSIDGKELSLEEAVLKFAESNSAALSTEGKSKADKQHASKAAEEIEGKIKKYQQEHPNASYKEALTAVAPNGVPNAVESEEDESEE